MPFGSSVGALTELFVSPHDMTMALVAAMRQEETDGAAVKTHRRENSVGETGGIADIAMFAQLRHGRVAGL